MNALDRIRKLVEDETGLDAATLGPHALEDAVRRRSSARGREDAEGYRLLVSDDPSEMEVLIDEIVIAESWCFRDGRPFEFLGEHVRQIGDQGPRPLRILSAPCSQGEEPFSIAMTLLESGLSPESFEIDGVDLSHRLIRMAGSAPYRESALRTVSETLRKLYFEPLASGLWAPSSALRACVRFRQGNIVDPVFAARLSPYRIIFCRNLMIYLRPESRESLLRNLEGLLEKGGVLFIGHADAGPRFFAGRFRPAGKPGAFAYYKESENVVSAKSGRSAGPSSAPRPRGGRAATGKKAHPATFPLGGLARDRTRARGASSPGELPGGLDRARKLADAGKLAEAESACHAHLRDHPQDGEAHYLLGAIQLAGGHRAEAEKSFRRVIYLDHGHVDALTHMAALCASRGDERGARGWRRRLERLARKRDAVQEESL